MDQLWTVGRTEVLPYISPCYSTTLQFSQYCVHTGSGDTVCSRAWRWLSLSIWNRDWEFWDFILYLKHVFVWHCWYNCFRMTENRWRPYSFLYEGVGLNFFYVGTFGIFLQFTGRLKSHVSCSVCQRKYINIKQNKKNKHNIVLCAGNVPDPHQCMRHICSLCVMQTAEEFLFIIVAFKFLTLASQ